MKKAFGVFMIVLIFSTLAMASSTVGVSFVIDGHDNTTSNYVPATGFWHNYGNYTVIILIVLIFYYIAMKIYGGNNRHSKKKISKNQKSKRK